MDVSLIELQIATGFRKDLFTGMNLIDLQKVLDNIDHQILLKEMEYLGFSKTQLCGLNF